MAVVFTGNAVRQDTNQCTEAVYFYLKWDDRTKGSVLWEGGCGSLGDRYVTH
jgi:hypothetical protein